MTDSDPFSRLTPRERRCLELVANHYDTAQIADELGITPATVNGYLTEARQKIGARNRKEAARMLAAHSAGSPTPSLHDSVSAPSKMGGYFDRVEDTPSDSPTPVPQPNEGFAPPAAPRRGGALSAILHFDRVLQPNQFGPGARLGMIAAMVVALAVAMALAVIAVVGLISIWTSLRS